MSVATYKVKRGDTLTRICSGGVGKNISSSISGNTVQAKINTIVKLNGIRNRNRIYVGQVLKLNGNGGSDSGSGGSNTSEPKSGGYNNQQGYYGLPKIDSFGLQADDTSGRAMFCTYHFDRPHVKNYKVRWLYYADGHWSIGNESTTERAEWEYRTSEYSAPERAQKVRVTVLGLSETYRDGQNNEQLYWGDHCWSPPMEYDFSNNPPYPPNAPSVEIKDYNLKIFMENIDLKKTNAEYMEFEIIKDNSTSLGIFSAKINTNLKYVEYNTKVPAGGTYKVRARSKRGSDVSSWSDLSSQVGTKPSKVEKILECKPHNYSVTEISVYLEWEKVNNAETYEIEYVTNKEYFDKTEQTQTKNGINNTKFEISGLTLGKEYYFRIRASNSNGNSEWSDIVSCVLGTTPEAPTTWSSNNTAIVGEDLYFYWKHNSEDNSDETFAEIRMYANDVLIQPDTTVKRTQLQNEEKKISEYKVITTRFPEGTELKWQVRTSGITKTFGKWSVQRVVNINAKPILQLAVTDKPEGNGNIIDTLHTFPFYIYGLTSPNTQHPLSYSVNIVANESYTTINEFGQSVTINKGDYVYNKTFNTNQALVLKMDAKSVNLEPNIEYTINCSAAMNTGLVAEASHIITPDWNDVEYELDASISINKDSYTASIIPYSMKSDGTLTENVTLSVYRREFDGTFTEIASGITNNNSTTITDPHPSLDYARYRIAAQDTNTGAISFNDLAGVEVNGISVVIQWDEEWSVFDGKRENNIEPPSWSGSMVSIPYNIKVSDNHSIDNEMVSYIGRKHPVVYYGTQLGESSVWNVEISKEDKDTLYALRRLAIWTDKVYVREPSGSGYWAHINVSFSQDYDNLVIPVSFNITRVEGGA